MSLLAQTLERAINGALEYDPGTRASLAQLQGRVLSIACTSPEGNLYFAVQGETLAVTGHYEGRPDCKLTGTLTSLMSLAFKPDPASLANTDVYIEGNPGVLNQFLAVVKNLDIDWEEALAVRIGSMPAHNIARVVRLQQHWLRERADKLPGYLTNLITEELRLTPSRNEAEVLYQKISDTRSHTARIEARLQQLKQKLNP